MKLVISSELGKWTIHYTMNDSILCLLLKMPENDLCTIGQMTSQGVYSIIGCCFVYCFHDELELNVCVHWDVFDLEWVFSEWDLSSIVA